MMAIVDGGMVGVLTLFVQAIAFKRRHRHVVPTGNPMLADKVFLVELLDQC